MRRLSQTPFAPIFPSMTAAAAAEDARRALPPIRLARPGLNCRRLARADAFAVIVDGADYFRALKHALQGARRSILMVGWEFDSRTRLVRDAPTSQPDEIGLLLDHLVRTRPGLRVRVLIWDSALIYAVNREFAGLVKMDWLTHRRLRFCLDDSHPLGASHHQKIVVIDEALAFVGGLDVTSQRWDSRGHRPDDPRRSDPAFASYPPFHDVMAMASGEAARALADICRERWQAATGQKIAPCEPADEAILWPPWAPRWFPPVMLAIARTAPPWDGQPGMREVENLYLDMIAQARRFIYVENQYFASRSIAKALAARLEAEDCPEIVVVNPGLPISLVERSTMGVARERVLQRLRRADRHGRLHVCFPVRDGHDIKIHSKLMVVDDCWLRVGSSNLNNRSMGLDTECDVLVEAMGDKAVEDAIRRVRHDLLAEHLGVAPSDVAEAEARCGGGVLAALRSLEGGTRTLVPLESMPAATVFEFMADSDLPDPQEPVETLLWQEEALSGPVYPSLQRHLRVLALGLAAVLAVALLWPFLPPEWRHGLDEALAVTRGEPLAALPVSLLVMVGGLARVPAPVMVVGAAMALGPWIAVAHSLGAMLVSALLAYGAGAALGRTRVRRMAGGRINQVHRTLVRHGLLGLMLLRLMPMAAFVVVNLAAGAMAVRLRDFIVGTVLGLFPGIIAMSVLGDRLLAVLRTPSTENAVVLAVAVALIGVAQWGVAGRLARARQVTTPTGQ